MKQLWIKKTVWKRHLIEDPSVDIVKDILAVEAVDNYNCAVDLYDMSRLEEYDCENVVLLPDNNGEPTAQIKDMDGRTEWDNLPKPTGDSAK